MSHIHIVNLKYSTSLKFRARWVALEQEVYLQELLMWVI